jgi:hypothetical protein
MLGQMKDGQTGARKVTLDGVERVVDQVMIGQSVTCNSGQVLVRVDREVEVNYLDVEPAFPFELEVRRGGNGAIKLGDRFDVVVKPRQESRCPIARVYLPGMLAFLEGGANAQLLVKPVLGQELVLPAVAVRKGSGSIYAVLSDMYDSRKVGTIPAMPLSVEG